MPQVAVEFDVRAVFLNQHVEVLDTIRLSPELSGSHGQSVQSALFRVEQLQDRVRPTGKIGKGIENRLTPSDRREFDQRSPDAASGGSS